MAFKDININGTKIHNNPLNKMNSKGFIKEIRKAIKEGWFSFDDLSDNCKDDVIPLFADMEQTSWLYR